MITILAAQITKKVPLKPKMYQLQWGHFELIEVALQIKWSIATNKTSYLNQN